MQLEAAKTRSEASRVQKVKTQTLPASPALKPDVYVSPPSQLRSLLRSIRVAGATDLYSWPFAPALLPAIDWANKQGCAWNKSRVAAKMTRYVGGTISAPLTKMSLELSPNLPKGTFHRCH